MYEIPKETRDFYINHPKELALRRNLAWSVFFTQVLTNNSLISNQTEEQLHVSFDALWDVAISYWLFPDDEDYLAIIKRDFKEINYLVG